jgi:hypothetical protein
LPGPPPPPAVAAGGSGSAAFAGPGSQGSPAGQQQQLSGPPSFNLRRNAAGGVGSRCADMQLGGMGAWWRKRVSVHARFAVCAVYLRTGCVMGDCVYKYA